MRDNLDASVNAEGTLFGYLALAFITGYNVDNFMKRLETIAQSAWGMVKSRADSISDEKTDDGDAHNG